MTKEQIKYMVDRFLGWRLPESFHPDGGISFQQFRQFKDEQYRNEPTGTNLLDAGQAEEMVRYMVDGLPDTEQTTEPGELGNYNTQQKSFGILQEFIDELIRESNERSIKANAEGRPLTHTVVFNVYPNALGFGGCFTALNFQDADTAWATANEIREKLPELHFRLPMFLQVNKVEAQWLCAIPTGEFKTASVPTETGSPLQVTLPELIAKDEPEQKRKPKSPKPKSTKKTTKK